MKKGAALFGLASVVGLGIAAVLFGGILYLTNPMTDVAEECLALIAQNRIHEASQLHAEVIRTDVVNRAQFENLYRDSILTKYRGVSWHYRKVQGDWGLLQGIVETSDPSYPEIFVEVEFVKESGEWRIFAFRYSPVN